MRLNLAAGARGFPGFINSDIAPFAGVNGIQHVDLRKPLPYADGSASLVMMSHALCLQPPEIRPKILSEIYRVLQPGGWFRLDDNPFRFWVGDNIDRKFWPPEYLMPREDLVELLKQVGFRVVKEINPATTQISESPETQWALISNKRFHESFTLECQK